VKYLSSIQVVSQLQAVRQCDAVTGLQEKYKGAEQGSAIYLQYCSFCFSGLRNKKTVKEIRDGLTTEVFNFVSGLRWPRSENCAER